MSKLIYSAFISFLLCSLCSADGGSSVDEVYDDIFKLLEEKEMLEQKLEKMEKSKSKRGSDESCSKAQQKLRLLSDVVEERREETDRLKREVKEAREKEELVKQRERECRVDEGERMNAVTEKVKFRGRYTFPVEHVERAKADSPLVLEHLKHGKPIVITGCNLTQSAVDNWSLEYLNSQLADQVLQICVTPNRQFKYYSRENRGNYIFDPPYSAYNGTFKTFLELADTVDNTKHGSRLYFEQLLSDINVSSDMQIDLSAFNWDWVNINVLPVTGWGKLQHTFLSVGKKDVTIAALYDTAENLFATISGYQKLVLFSPTQHANLYPFPVHHPQDRQSQVNFDGPNFDKFPQFREAKGFEAVVSPGDVVYVPAYWWRYIENSDQGMTVSLKFLFQVAWMREHLRERNQMDEEEQGEDRGLFVVPDEVKELKLQREVESLIGNTVDPSKMKKILKTILNRRFDFLNIQDK